MPGYGRGTQNLVHYCPCLPFASTVVVGSLPKGEIEAGALQSVPKKERGALNFLSLHLHGSYLASSSMRRRLHMGLKTKRKKKPNDREMLKLTTIPIHEHTDLSSVQNSVVCCQGAELHADRDMR